MKNQIILITLMLVSLLLFGCTQTPSGTGLFALDNNKNSNLTDTNSIDSNSNIYNNLNDLNKVKINDHVAVDYIGKLTDGKVFDSSIGREPLEFDVGAGQMIKGFDDGVIGMKIGETKTITIPPEQAYGTTDSKKLITFDKNSPELSGLGPVTVGMELNSGYGIVKVVAVNDSNIVIDFNHKLAGKTLIFDITLISIN